MDLSWLPCPRIGNPEVIQQATKRLGSQQSQATIGYATLKSRRSTPNIKGSHNLKVTAAKQAL